MQLNKLKKERFHYQSLFNATNEIMLLVDKKTGKILDCNEKSQKEFKLTKSRIINQVWYERFIPAEASLTARHQLLKQLKSLTFRPFNVPLYLSSNQQAIFEFTIVLIDGYNKSYLLLAKNIDTQVTLNKENRALHVELSTLKKQLSEQKEHFYTTFEMSVNGIAILDDQGKLIYSNKKLQKMLEHNDVYFKLRGLGVLFDDEESFESLLQSSKTHAEIEKMYLIAYTEKNQAIHIEFSMSYMKKAKEYFVIIQDITQSIAKTNSLQKEMKEYEMKAQLDALTSIYNRAYLDKSLYDLHHANERYSFIMFDIDYFKKVNDTYGHLIGDDVLIELSALVKNILRINDIFARYGGEEFAIILKNTSLEDSKKLTEKIRLLIQENVFSGVKHLTCSFGLSSSQKNELPRDIITRADKALYLAKENGRNRVIVL